MNTTASESTDLSEAGIFDLIREIESRGDDMTRLAIAKLRAGAPWWRRFQLGQKIWGLSSSWFAACLWNGDEAWVTLPFVTLIAGTKHIELVLGHGRTINFEIRWRWD